MQGELSNPSRAAHFYEEKLRELFPGEPLPRFDLVLLGIGEDGHTASLFPETDALKEKERWVVANYVTALSEWRITLTLPAINAAWQILFLATGARKARIVAEAFGGAEHAGVLPSELVIPANGARDVLLDKEAAAMLG
jgi:6-phosphogluconolactonase